MPSIEKTHKEVCAAGGRATVRHHGKDHMREIGKQGAKAVLQKYGTEHMKKLRKIGGKKRGENMKKKD